MRGPTLACPMLVLALASGLVAGEPPENRTYENRLTPIENPRSLLASYPEFVHRIDDTDRFEAPALIEDEHATLSVRAWRFSYNARGIVEIPNRLDGRKTALIVVHPWGIDDGQVWNTPEPAGVAFQCTPKKNLLVRRHARQVIAPLIKRLRDDVSLVMYSLPGGEDALRRQMYRGYTSSPTEESRQRGRQQLEAKLAVFEYKGQPLPVRIDISVKHPTKSYFASFAGLNASDTYNNAGFWSLPVPVMKDIPVALDDVVIYDALGYAALREFLNKQGICHVLLTGYNTDMCVCSTTAGYENLRENFNVFLVGDATIATFPANPDPTIATTAAVSKASLNLLVTETGWIRELAENDVAQPEASR